MKRALLTGVIEKGSGEDTPSPKNFSSAFAWFELAIANLPTLLKLLAALGLFKQLNARSRKNRQNLSAARAAKRSAVFARAERDRWC
jgi:hypothetical protein